MKNTNDLNLSYDLVLYINKKLHEKFENENRFMEHVLALFDFLVQTETEFSKVTDKEQSLGVDLLDLCRAVQNAVTNLFFVFDNNNKNWFCSLVCLLVEEDASLLVLLVLQILSKEKRNFRLAKGIRNKTQFLLMFFESFQLKEKRIFDELVEKSKFFLKAKSMQYFVKIVKLRNWERFLQGNLSRAVKNQDEYKKLSQNTEQKMFQSSIWKGYETVHNSEGKQLTMLGESLQSISTHKSKLVSKRKSGSHLSETHSFPERKGSMDEEHECEEDEQKAYWQKLRAALASQLHVRERDELASLLEFSSAKPSFEETLSKEVILIENSEEAVERQEEHEHCVSFNSSQAAITYPCMTMEGYLMRYTKSLFAKRTLKNYWYSLKGNYLSCFKTPHSRVPSNDLSYDLVDASVREQEISKNEGGGYCLGIVFKNRKTLQLYTTSFEAKEKWIACLNAATKSYNVVI